MSRERATRGGPVRGGGVDGEEIAKAESEKARAQAAAARSDNAALRDELLSLFERARTLKPKVAAVTLAPAVATERPLPPSP